MVSLEQWYLAYSHGAFLPSPRWDGRIETMVVPRLFTFIYMKHICMCVHRCWSGIRCPGIWYPGTRYPWIRYPWIRYPGICNLLYLCREKNLGQEELCHCGISIHVLVSMWTIWDSYNNWKEHCKSHFGSRPAQHNECCCCCCLFLSQLKDERRHTKSLQEEIATLSLKCKKLSEDLEQMEDFQQRYEEEMIQVGTTNSVDIWKIHSNIRKHFVTRLFFS